MSAAFIHPTALVDSRAIGDGTRIWAFAHILEGAVIGGNCNIADRVFVEGGGRIGNNVTVKNNVCVWQGVTIEDDVFIGPNVTFTNDRYPRSPRMREVRQRYSDTRHWLETTVLRRGCSVGANATILPGLELGEYCVVAAGAVVTRNVAPFALIVGSPGRQVASVCRCGQRLDGPYDTTVCDVCGETPQERIKSLAA